MTAPSPWHTEVLTDTQGGVLRQLGPLAAEEGYYLAGGTAVGLYLGHRRSVDLDWFSSAGLPDPLALAARLAHRGVSFRTGQVAPGTLHGAVEGVRVSFLEYRYPLIEPPVAWVEAGCDLASLDDLACMKLAALAQRGSRKDFLDVYALCVAHRPLPELLARYREKYRIGDVAHVLYALSYFDDAEREPDPLTTMLWSVAWQEIKASIQGWVVEAAGPPEEA